MIVLYYLIFTFRRWMRASQKDDIREWKARFILLWLEINLVLTMLWALKALPDRLDPILVGILVTLPLVWFNEKTLANRKRWIRYSAKFARWGRVERLAADMGVVILIGATFAAPFVLKSLESNRPWWK